MEFAVSGVLLLHVIGWALLFGGCAAQWRRPYPWVTTGMLNGALLLVVTGIILVILAELGPDPVSHAKVTVKAIIGLILAALVALNRRWDSIPRGLLAIISALALVNAAVAILW